MLLSLSSRERTSLRSLSPFDPLESTGVDWSQLSPFEQIDSPSQPFLRVAAVLLVSLTGEVAAAPFRPPPIVAFR